MAITLRILDNPSDMQAVEELQLAVWSGGETSIVPAHLLIAAVHNGGVLIGAYLNQENTEDSTIIGFVFGFPGFYDTPDGPRLLHISHMLGVLSSARDQGVGFMLKRAQWQLVRKQGVDRIIWTFDPLQSRNAYLNIAKLGAVCNTYHENYYGELRDELRNGEILYALREAQVLIEQWRVDYNTIRPHSALGYRPPAPENIIPGEEFPRNHEAA